MRERRPRTQAEIAFAEAGISPAQFARDFRFTESRAREILRVRTLLTFDFADIITSYVNHRAGRMVFRNEFFIPTDATRAKAPAKGAKAKSSSRAASRPAQKNVTEKSRRPGARQQTGPKISLSAEGSQP